MPRPQILFGCICLVVTTAVCGAPPAPTCNPCVDGPEMMNQRPPEEAPVTVSTIDPSQLPEDLTELSDVIANGNERRFAPNQEWAYRTRPQDADSTLVIGVIEDHPKLGSVVHIAIRGVNLGPPDGMLTTEIGHAPISANALAESVTDLLGVAPQPQSVLEGIKVWKEAKGGVYTISVSEIVETAQQTFSASGTW